MPDDDDDIASFSSQQTATKTGDLCTHASSQEGSLVLKELFEERTLNIEHTMCTQPGVQRVDITGMQLTTILLHALAERILLRNCSCEFTLQTIDFERAGRRIRWTSKLHFTPDTQPELLDAFEVQLEGAPPHAFPTRSSSPRSFLVTTNWV